jgi:hypothetical protein
MKYLLIILSFSITSLIYAQGDTKQHILFKEIKEKYETEITNQCDTFKSHFNDKEAIGRINFLNKDFSTTLFSKYSSVGYWYCNANDSENKRMNIGIISILFKNEKDREVVEKKIKSVKRRNFKVKLLTRFKLNASKCELLIIFSETVRNKSTATFLEKL